MSGIDRFLTLPTTVQLDTKDNIETFYILESPYIASYKGTLRAHLHSFQIWDMANES